MGAVLALLCLAVVVDESSATYSGFASNVGYGNGLAFGGSAKTLAVNGGVEGVTTFTVPLEGDIVVGTATKFSQVFNFTAARFEVLVNGSIVTTVPVVPVTAYPVAPAFRRGGVWFTKLWQGTVPAGQALQVKFFCSHGSFNSFQGFDAVGAEPMNTMTEFDALLPWYEQIHLLAQGGVLLLGLLVGAAWLAVLRCAVTSRDFLAGEVPHDDD